MKAAIEDPQVKKGFETAGAEPMWMPLDQVKKWHHDEIAKYRNIITKAGIAQIE
jgi:tripartite-type tricarboxylate transporter receptor subunit TctC